MTRDSITGVIENPLSQNRYTYAWNNPVNYTDPSGHWPQFLDDAVKSAVNFGKQVVNSVVNFGRNVVNTVSSVFTGSSRSQSSASSSGSSRTSSTTRSGRKEEEELALTANSAVNNVKPPGSYGSSVKCHATLAVSEDIYQSFVDGVIAAYKKATEFHFEKRDELNGPHPSYLEVTKRDSEWTQLPEWMSVEHDNGRKTGVEIYSH